MNPLIPLSSLRKGAKALIDSHRDPDLEVILMEMGCVPGEPVQVKMIAPLGDPIAIEIAGYQLSLRKRDAEQILVRVVG